jgi:uncharacterized protein (TIGR03089 family)
MTSPEGLFDARLTAAPAQPFVTYYDDASGERTELSARSLANWVAKTHFLLTTELGLGRGDAAYVDLPAHWISIPPLLGSWTAGLDVVTDPARAAVAFVDPDRALQAVEVPDVYVIAPDSAAVGLTPDRLPPGMADYVSAVRPQADSWTAVHPLARPNDPALDGQTRAQLVDAAAERAQSLGLGDGARVLTAREWHGPRDWLDVLLAPLSVGGSVVLVRHSADVDRRQAQERATVVV